MYAMQSLEGRQLGNYEVVRRIRVGGMGAVYEGKQRTAFDRRVAIKVILGDYATDREMRRRFAREARTIARLHHPHILPLIEFGDERGMLYLVMPFIEGGTLTSFLRHNLPDLNEIVAIYQQLLDAVEYAHDEGLIHRDIKSSNVLLEERRTGAPYIYLADFGLVRTSRQAELERAGQPIPLEQVPGTPHYMAPEQTMGVVTTLTDIYALGVLLFQLLTGELPYDDPDEVRVIQMQLYSPIPSPSESNPAIPVELDEVIQKAMAKRPEERYRNVAELRRAFLAAIQGRGPIAPFEETEDGEITFDDETFPVTGRPILASVPATLLPREPAVAPSALPTGLRREKPVPVPITFREKQRVTGSAVKSGRRITESVPPKANKREGKLGTQRRRSSLPLILGICVPIALILLLIVPKVFSVSLFPAGFPILGADPTATVSITAQSRTFQNSYLVMVSPNVKSADLATRSIPDHSFSQTISDSRSTQTTGTMLQGGLQASGSLLLINNSDKPITVVSGVIYTSTTGVQVQTRQTVTAPAKQNGQQGTATVGAVAVDVGSDGNIPANSVATKCCGGLTVINPQAFSGGSNTHTVHIVVQADLDRISGPLSLSLQQQLLRKMVQSLNTGEVMAELPAYTTTVTSSSPIGAEVDQVTVTVTVSAKAIVYNRDVANQMVEQLLSTQAQQTLNNTYRLVATPTVDVPVVVKTDKNGVVYLSLTVHEIWAYIISAQQLSQWSRSIEGDTQGVALAFLNKQVGVAEVQIVIPSGTDHLPTSSNHIQIAVLNG